MLFAYLLVAIYGPDSEQASSIISDCTTTFLQKERRQSTETDDIYRHGRKLFNRRRKVRKDKGFKRAFYKPKKKHAGLHQQPNARKLVREGGSVAMEDVEGGDEHSIFEQLSPRRSEKKRGE